MMRKLAPLKLRPLRSKLNSAIALLSFVVRKTLLTSPAIDNASNKLMHEYNRRAANLH